VAVAIVRVCSTGTTVVLRSLAASASKAVVGMCRLRWHAGRGKLQPWLEHVDANGIASVGVFGGTPDVREDKSDSVERLGRRRVPKRGVRGVLEDAPHGLDDADRAVNVALNASIQN
jgi:hypothetical protein